MIFACLRARTAAVLTAAALAAGTLAVATTVVASAASVDNLRGDWSGIVAPDMSIFVRSDFKPFGDGGAFANASLKTAAGTRIPLLDAHPVINVVGAQDYDKEYRGEHVVLRPATVPAPGDYVLRLSYSEIGDAVCATYHLSKCTWFAAEEVTKVWEFHWSGTKVTIAPAKLRMAEAPSIKGKHKVGATLSVNPVAWRGTAPSKITYRWYRNGHKIASATHSTFHPGSSDRGAKISARITGKRTGYKSASHTTKAVRIR